MRYCCRPRTEALFRENDYLSPLTYLDASTPGSGGFIDGPAQRLSIQHILPFGTPSKLAQVPIDGTHGVRLGDVATVVEGHPPLTGDAVVHGGRGLLLAVDKRPGASTLAVTHELQSALDDLRPGLPGVTVDSSVFRPAVYLRRECPGGVRRNFPTEQVGGQQEWDPDWPAFIDEPEIEKALTAGG